MNAGTLQHYIEETCGAVGENLFARRPSFRVFRHSGNCKWFAFYPAIIIV